MINIIGLCGSLRHGSFNRMLLRAAVEVASPGTVIQPESIREIPLYDGDVEDEQGLPPTVGHHGRDSRAGRNRVIASGVAARCAAARHAAVVRRRSADI